VWCVGGGCSLALAPASSVARRACLFLPCLRGLAWSLLDGAWTWGRWRAIAVLFAQVGGCNTVLWQEALEEHGFFARETRLPCAPAMPEQAANCSSGTAGDSDRQGGRVHRQQQGVFRVNCVDCLDRTNVAQSVCPLRRRRRLRLWHSTCSRALHSRACSHARKLVLAHGCTRMS